MNSVARLRTVAAALWLATAAQPAFPQQPPPAGAVAPRIDALFAEWNSPDSPGCVYGVLREGRIIHSNAFGMADLARRTRLTTDTRFDIASMAKQFTAAIVALLVQEGRLSLQDDVRRHLPELPDYGTRISIAHLLHHQSGLRDYTVLEYLAGTRAQRTDNAAVLRLLARQKALNFRPGEEYLYSNSNYVLLAQIVERVTRQSLPELARSLLFRKLDMNDTLFLATARSPAGLATGYTSAPGSKPLPVTGTSRTYGDGHVASSLRDMARWDENFHSGTVGGGSLPALMRSKGVLASGAVTDYGLGLQFLQYRGHPVEMHGGTTDGFRSQWMRFPSLRTSVGVFCNASTANADRLAAQIADIVLSDRLAPQDPAPPMPDAVRIDPALFDDYAGDYTVTAGNGSYVMTASREGGRFFVQRPGIAPIEIFAASETEFFARSAPARFIFSRDASGAVTGISIVQSGGSREGTRVQPAAPSGGAPLEQYAGTFRSGELDAGLALQQENGRLVAVGPGWRMMLAARGADRFALPADGEIRFARDQAGAISGFSLSMARARNLEFVRSR